MVQHPIKQKGAELLILKCVVGKSLYLSSHNFTMDNMSYYFQPAPSSANTMTLNLDLNLSQPYPPLLQPYFSKFTY